jgi:hypothetical protein
MSAWPQIDFGDAGVDAAFVRSVSEDREVDVVREGLAA